MKPELTINDICSYIGIDTPGDFYSKNIDNCDCQCCDEEYLVNGEWVVATQDYICEACSFDYIALVEEYFSKLLAYHELFMDSRGGKYIIKPMKNWHNSMKSLLETINGYGLFYFSGVREAVLSGPYSGYSDFVLNHIHWVAAYPKVYEGTSAKNEFMDLLYKRR